MFFILEKVAPAVEQGAKTFGILPV